MPSTTLLGMYKAYKYKWAQKASRTSQVKNTMVKAVHKSPPPKPAMELCAKAALDWWKSGGACSALQRCCTSADICALDARCKQLKKSEQYKTDIQSWYVHFVYKLPPASLAHDSMIPPPECSILCRGSTKSSQSDAWVGSRPIDEHLYRAKARHARLPKR